MYLNENLSEKYSHDNLPAVDAQRMAQFIAFGPVIFQVARIMMKHGIFDLLAKNPLTVEEVAEKSNLSKYAAKCLLESSLTSGTVIVDPVTEKFSLSKTGFFLMTDAFAKVNVDFNHDVNYLGFFNLEESLLQGKPVGLKTFGDWHTIYEGLSSLPEDVQKSWFAFDHFYSDCSFESALKIVFSRKVENLMDVGGNTGRWATQCVTYNPDVNVTIVDLPQQLEMMKRQTSDLNGADRIDGFAANLLDENSQLPSHKHFDAIWMSQFLDCFSEDEILSILKRAAKVMADDTRLYIMETCWDRQKFDTAAFCLTQISLYFTALANGNSKMYHSNDLLKIVEASGLLVEEIHDNLGLGHTIFVCKKA